MTSLNLLKTAELIFFDFDGVIKESLTIKSNAFEELFLPFGEDIAARVKIHHNENSGVSRLKKIPLYLSWVEPNPTDCLINKFCAQFSQIVMRAVIDSPWVPGAQKFLLDYYKVKYFVLVTATPQHEIESILSLLNIDKCFRHIFCNEI